MEKPRKDPCIGSQIELAVFVNTRRELFHRRMGIRNSWAKDASKNMIIRFVIGDPVLEEEEGKKFDKLLDEEQKQFGDLIRYYNITEGYHMLQFKVGAAFQWQQKWCPNAEYVMKTDDDAIIDLPRWAFWNENKFKKQLKETGTGLAFFGYLVDETPTIREKDNKWYLSKEEYPNEILPKYMHNTFFANSKTIKLVMKHTKEFYGIHIEDTLYAGIIAKKANISLFDLSQVHIREDNLVDNEKCELGKPKIFSILQKTLTSSTEYKEEYKKLHNLKCKY
uniref:Hexosyltransferase n=1 Tax=Meloidogyne enterolobii TaxID=390850 RepID=A0A6V7XBR3_MELEN|nr:unnamed protein product [Meloidogyne enterolobii]